MKRLLSIFLFSAVYFTPGSSQSIAAYNQLKSTFRSECLDMINDRRLVVLYDSLLDLQYKARIEALDTVKGMTPAIRNSYISSIKANKQDQYLQEYSLARNYNRTLEEHKMMMAMQYCIELYEPPEKTIPFSYDPNKSISMEEAYKHLKNNKPVIKPFEPFWIDLTFNNGEKSIGFKTDWNEAKDFILTFIAPEGCQICALIYSEKGSWENTYTVKEYKGYVLDDPDREQRIYRYDLDIHVSGSRKVWDRHGGLAKVANVRMQIMPYYYDYHQRQKYDCFTPRKIKQFKNTRDFHEKLMDYDPKSQEDGEIILEDI